MAVVVGRIKLAVGGSCVIYDSMKMMKMGGGERKKMM